MAVSPTVQAYMSGPQSQAPINAEQSFHKNFGDAAFNLLRAKAPDLLRYVVTFKVLSTDLDKETGLGVFVIRNGDDVRYVPVVLADGAVNSCEMLYDKAADQFSPLSEDAIKGILGRNRMTEAQVLTRDAHIEDTRQLFRDLLRPPASSNIVLSASGPDPAVLPNAAKERIGLHLAAHPDLLARIAAFYPPVRLGEKLAAIRPDTPAIIQPASDVVRLETVSKEEAAFLSAEERAELLQHGYLVKRAAETALALPLQDLEQHLAVELRVEAVRASGPDMPPLVDCAPVCRAEALCCEPKGFRREPVLAAGLLLLGKDGAWNDLRERGALLAGRSERVAAEDLKAFGAVDIHGLTKALVDLKSRPCQVVAFCPTRRGGYLAAFFRQGACPADSLTVRPMENETYVQADLDRAGTGLRVTPLLHFGCVRRQGELSVPAGALFAALSQDKALPPPGLIGSFDELRGLMRSLGTPLTISRDGVALHVTDRRRDKTASFATEADAAEWLHRAYDLTGAQIRGVLGRTRSVVFNKRAFEEPDAVPVSGVVAARPENGGGLPGPLFDPSALDAYAATGEPELVDTGILASFARDPDIKALLVDYLPDFMIILDRMGRLILLLNLRKDDFETFYGSDKYAETLGNCRKIFTQVGEIAHLLQQYINMH